VFTDVERLCNVHIPRWFKSDGMGADKIAAFYEDSVREAYHAHSAYKAFHLRSLTIEPGLTWAARRWLRFLARLAIGKRREWLARFGVGRAEPVTRMTETKSGIFAPRT